MKQWLILGALVACIFLPLSSAVAASEAQAERLGFTPEEVKVIKEAIKRGQFGSSGTQKPPLRPGGPERGPIVPAGPLDPTGIEPEGRRLDELSKPRDIGNKYGSVMEGSGKLIYARPFVASPKAILGGYYDFEYINRKNDGDPSTFDAHRLVPFIYGDISNNVKFAAEIEIEHGGLNGSQTRTDLKIEFAVIDYLMVEPVNFRAGIILVPLGKFNLLHDSPLRDLTIRPLVANRIIPTTLHQPGIGLYGTLYPTSLSQLNYEVYLTSGFTNAFGGSGNPLAVSQNRSNITNTNGLRSARSNSTDFDNNEGKTWVGRVAFSPILGVEVGGSALYGSYDPASQRHILMGAVDWTFQRGPFELIGESAWAYIQDNDQLVTGGDIPNNTTNPDSMHGYYIQGNYHFLPQWLTDLFPTHFRQEVSTFTAVVRWNQIFLGQGLGGEAEALGNQQRLEAGFNFRPTEDTVFKANFEYDPRARRGSQRIHDVGGIASVATYF